MKLFFLLVLTSLAITQSDLAFGLPAQVILIRHGEKPTEGPDLNATGYARANALPSFFKDNPIVNQFGPVVAFYAAGPQDAGDSLRSIETITPTANAFHLPVQSQIKRDDIQELVKTISTQKEYDGHTVAIAWEHNLIPGIAQDFGATNTPTSWDDAVFDRAWVLTFLKDGTIQYQNIGEHALPTDSN